MQPVNSDSVAVRAGQAPGAMTIVTCGNATPEGMIALDLA